MMKCSKRKRTGTVSEQPTTTDNTNKWELASSASHLVSNYQQQMINGLYFMKSMRLFEI